MFVTINAQVSYKKGMDSKLSKRVNYTIVPMIKGNRVIDYAREELIELRNKYIVVRDATSKQGLQDISTMYKERIRIIEDELFRRDIR